MTAVRGSSERRWTKHLIGGGITLLCLVVFVRQVDVREIMKALASFQWPYLIVGLVSLASGYALRIVRWTMLLRAAKAPVRFPDCTAPFLGSIALNNVLPLRLGDVVRALVFPASMGVTRTVATSSLIVERLVDLMTLLASLAIGLYALNEIVVPAGLKRSAVGLAIIGGVVLATGFLCSGYLGRFFARVSATSGSGPASPRVAKTCSILAALFQGFDVMSRPLLLVSIVAVSMLIWFGEAGLFYFMLVGLDIEATPIVALLVMAVATLSTLVPSSPGYVGPFHLAAFTAISLVGGSATQAGSYAVLVHLALWVPTTLAGALAIWAQPGLFRAARQQPV